MKHTYVITGMTCNGCVASVTEKLSNVKGVTHVVVDLAKDEAEITRTDFLTENILRSAISNKYTSTEKKGIELEILAKSEPETSKIQQLKPLLLIFIYLFSAAFLLNFKDWNSSQAMLDFMGLFYIVFSFFKLLDLKGFPISFHMYDPLAKIFPGYAWAYPFLGLTLGLMFLMRFEVTIALIVTVFILGVTTIGVTNTLLDKKGIQCACLGTALKLPMSEATFIENTIMLVMALTMFAQQFI